MEILWEYFLRLSVAYFWGLYLYQPEAQGTKEAAFSPPLESFSSGR